jgi:hypothetical protein
MLKVFHPKKIFFVPTKQMQKDLLSLEIKCSLLASWYSLILFNFMLLKLIMMMIWPSVLQGGEKYVSWSGMV